MEWHTMTPEEAKRMKIFFNVWKWTIIIIGSGIVLVGILNVAGILVW